MHPYKCSRISLTISAISPDGETSALSWHDGLLFKVFWNLALSDMFSIPWNTSLISSSWYFTSHPYVLLRFFCRCTQFAVFFALLIRPLAYFCRSLRLKFPWASFSAFLTQRGQLSSYALFILYCTISTANSICSIDKACHLRNWWYHPYKYPNQLL